MIAIFDNFRRKMAFFSKTTVMIKFLQKINSVLSKNANLYANNFWENIFEIITSVSGSFLLFQLLLLLFWTAALAERSGL
jgi:hypothetical protein